MLDNLDGNHELAYKGFDELVSELEIFIHKTQNYLDILEVGAQEFVSDLLKLTKPYSKIYKTGYTHLVNTFTYRKSNIDVAVGWGKYYGRMVEKGTVKMHSQSHLEPTFNANKNKYYQKMINKFYN